MSTYSQKFKAAFAVEFLPPRKAWLLTLSEIGQNALHQKPPFDWSPDDCPGYPLFAWKTLTCLQTLTTYSF